MYKMKSLKQFVKEINEAVEIYRLSSVIAKFFVQPDEIMFQAPETYSESDIQIYIDDKWLNELPTADKYAKKFFGVNKDSIIDAHFEYDSFEHLSVEPKEYIEWDVKYDSKNVKDDVKLEYFKIRNLKYIIEFDTFDLTNASDDTVKDKLVEIFKAVESNNYNKYPIEITFDEDSLEYRK